MGTNEKMVLRKHLVKVGNSVLLQLSSKSQKGISPQTRFDSSTKDTVSLGQSINIFLIFYSFSTLTFLFFISSNFYKFERSNLENLILENRPPAPGPKERRTTLSGADLPQKCSNVVPVEQKVCYQHGFELSIEIIYIIMAQGATKTPEI